MKSNIHRGAQLGVWVALVLALLGACGKASSSSGSNSNWLEPCSVAADCGTGLECWCHVCAAPCGDGQACAQPGGSCESAAARGCGEVAQSSSVCVASCDSTADCRAFGEALRCLNRACVGVADDGPGGGGSSAGDKGGTGGSEPVPTGEVSAIAIGEGQRCVASQGRVYCWGNNGRGEVGVQPLTDAWTPQLLPEVADAVELAASNYHTCALTRGGDVYCWGYNSSGEVGSESAPEDTCPDLVLDKPGDYPCQPRPTRVAAISGARHIAVSDGRSCAVLSDDSVTCWGNVTDISTWVGTAEAPLGLALAPAGACAITPEGKLSCSNEALETRTLTQLEAVSLSPGVDDRFGCALDGAGEVRCWGDDTYGQLGEREATGRLTNPIDDVAQIVTAAASACALSSNGSVWCWGKNSSGEAGRAPLASPNCGTENCESSPRRVEDLPKVTKLAAGGRMTCAVAEDAGVWCWGGDFFYTAGTPRRVPGPWEGGEAACVAQAVAASAELRNGPRPSGNSHACVTDQDCTHLSIDLPCLHSCETVSVSKLDSEAVGAVIADLAERYCDAAPATCAPHEVDCPPRSENDRDVCLQGTCTRADSSTSGCTDTCGCLAERSAAWAVLQGDCVGPDLWVVVSLPCERCGPGGAYFVVGNRGDAAFSGPAVLSFEPEDPNEAALVPAPRSLDLTLAPGEMTKAIYVENSAHVLVRPRITADGDCEPRNDNSSGVTFPGTQTCR